ncbi:hypothetical protein CNR29_07390 [Levilactobacillus brevis]|uniref:Phage Mu protein F like protein n=1 Tax=Levilactobacillus brevis TaxID=1580 RepID=A0A2A3TYR8_LEVBR|nr:hypothetical protein [Levilactobacillus brevis]PBQ23848.1 hypothetical protein CNR29_07390 [Levilactobacillus brevis]
MVSLTIQQERQRIKQLIDLDNQTDVQSSQYYRECLMYIRNHLTQFYARYANDNGLTVSQVSIRASHWELKEWQDAIRQTDMSDWPNEAFVRIKAYNAQIHIDRKHVLAALIGLTIIIMTVKNQRNIERRIGLDADTELRRMKTSFNLSKKQAKKIGSIISQARRQSKWSANLWIDSDSLANDIETLVNKYLRHDMQLTDIDGMLTEHANPTQFKPGQSVADRVKQMEYNSRRIVRTESARLTDEVNMTTYRMKNVKMVDWIAEPGACAKCAGTASNGPYLLDDAPLIPDDSHPNCRCHKTPASDPNFVDFNNY